MPPKTQRRRASWPEEALAYISATLRPLAAPIMDLTPDPENARIHEDADLLVIGNSLREYGQQKPIVARREHRGMTNVVLAGNGTLLAARAIGWTHLAVSWFEGTDEQAEEYRLVDNRSAELSRWDFTKLADQMRAVAKRDSEAKLQFLGWTEADASEILHGGVPQGDGSTEGRTTGQHHVVLTEEQYVTVGAAIAKVRKGEDDDRMSEGRVVELICANYLAGA